MTATAPKLKDISDSDIRHFLGDLERYDATEQYSQGQASLIAEAIMDHEGLWSAICAIIEHPDSDAVEVAMSSIVAGFQLGRTFEIKAMARAMREGRG